MNHNFELIGEIIDIETIAVNLSIRELKRLKAQFGGRRWRKLKGVALVQFPNGRFVKLNYIGMKHTESVVER